MNLDKHYGALSACITEFSQHNHVLLMGDMNARVGLSDDRSDDIEIQMWSRSPRTGWRACLSYQYIGHVSCTLEMQQGQDH